jgi:hypothetical protein
MGSAIADYVWGDTTEESTLEMFMAAFKVE